PGVSPDHGAVAMRAMILTETGPFGSESSPLRLAELPLPEPAPREARLRISACGVCHTELDEIEGRVPTAKLPIVLGHEAVGYVDALGEHARRHRPGDRVGVGWIHHSSGGEHENLSPEFRAT